MTEIRLVNHQSDFDEATLESAAARAGPKLRAAIRFLLRREWPPRDDLPGAGDDLED